MVNQNLNTALLLESNQKQDSEFSSHPLLSDFHPVKNILFLISSVPSVFSVD